MDVRFCPACVSRGVDCPLMVEGECTHCGRHDAPISHRIADFEYRFRFAWDSFRFRVGVPRVSVRLRRALACLFGVDR